MFEAHVKRPRRILSWLLLSSLVALSGCAIWGPDYEKPQLETPDDWKSKDRLARIDGVPLPEMAWWDRFKDPVLNDLIKRALIQNNSVQAALGNIFHQSLDYILNTPRAQRIRRGFDCREPAEALCRRCHYASRFNIPLPQSNKK